MYDFFRNLRDQDRAIRRLSEGPLRYLRENQTAIEQAQELLRSNSGAVSKSLAVLDVKSRLAELAHGAALIKETFSSLALRDSVLDMRRFADQHREVNAALDRARLPYKEIAAQVEAMSRYFESTQAAFAAIDYSRIGALISADQGRREIVARTTLLLEHRNADLIASLNLSEGRLASAPPFVENCRRLVSSSTVVRFVASRHTSRTILRLNRKLHRYALRSLRRRARSSSSRCRS